MAKTIKIEHEARESFFESFRCVESDFSIVGTEHLQRLYRVTLYCEGRLVLIATIQRKLFSGVTTYHFGNYQCQTCSRRVHIPRFPFSNALPSPYHQIMGHWILGLVVLGAWVVGVLSQDDISFPFSVESATRSNECDSVVLMFPGGVTPYSIYYSVANVANNYNTWSEENLVIGNDALYFFFVSPDIGMSTSISSIELIDQSIYSS
jgi:hypothetical protein